MFFVSNVRAVDPVGAWASGQSIHDPKTGDE